MVGVQSSKELYFNHYLLYRLSSVIPRPTEALWIKTKVDKADTANIRQKKLLVLKC